MNYPERTRARSPYRPITVAPKPAPKLKTLEDTCKVVGHFHPTDTINIDGDHPLTYPFWKYTDAARTQHLEKYRTKFYAKLDKNDPVFLKAIEDLVEAWQVDKCLTFSHDKPHLPNHSSVIIEYVCYELRKRGLAAGFR
jgi:hypothetical protein